jgi:hypothetical protein
VAGAAQTEVQRASRITMGKKILEFMDQISCKK